jgi:hypothetical protein
MKRCEKTRKVKRGGGSGHNTALRIFGKQKLENTIPSATRKATKSIGPSKLSLPANIHKYPKRLQNLINNYEKNKKKGKSDPVLNRYIKGLIQEYQENPITMNDKFKMIENYKLPYGHTHFSNNVI